MLVYLVLIHILVGLYLGFIGVFKIYLVKLYRPERLNFVLS